MNFCLPSFVELKQFCLYGRFFIGKALYNCDTLRVHYWLIFTILESAKEISIVFTNAYYDINCYTEILL